MKKFIICLTHDVDKVKKTYQYFSKDLKNFKFKNISSILKKKNDEPYYCFDKIIDLEDKYNVRSTFFFLQESLRFNIFSKNNWEKSLGKYKFSDNNIKSIIKILDNNGWEIGLHGSYNSYKDVELLKFEKHALESILGRNIKGIRQHYLNLDIPKTWVYQKEAGFVYDSSLGLKNEVGFPKKIYKPYVDSISGIKIIPITIMDGYLFNLYNNYDEMWSSCIKIIDEAERNEAVLNILWHQRVFHNADFPFYVNLYKKIIEECKNRNAHFVKCEDLI